MACSYKGISKKDFNNIAAVVDLAGISNDPACDLDKNLTEKINHQGTVNVATTAKAAGVPKYIMASSCSIYGASDGEPLNEKSYKKPVQSEVYQSRNSGPRRISPSPPQS